jgi:hypothetical protein
MNLQENIERIIEMMGTITEDEGDVDISDYVTFKGTKKPLGANGIGTKLVKELLHLMKTTFKEESELVTAANEIESTNKISRKNRSPFRMGLYRAQSACRKDSNFNGERLPNFCSEINEVLVSDNDNRFSMSYGIMGR